MTQRFNYLTLITTTQRKELKNVASVSSALMGMRKSLPTLENEDIRNGCNRLAEFYHQDLDAAELYQECLQFKFYVTMEDAKAKENQAPQSLFNLLYKKIRQYRLESMQSAV
ncbi:hypothetical protein OUZ56_021508 [Daphnia magna]|uniref:Uncharacterized protein n=1 Tax=Daphnia magna TaxID=35525 RepID=A0ABQ9ZHM4_9CRUS|nr:hypothetical protein OUZ56_021508 [Daphnia magna]